MWHLRAFDALTPLEWDRLCALRQRVFVLEQNCPFVDADGLDPFCFHLWMEENERVVACARLVPPGAHYAEASLGRVATALDHRNQGLGKAIVAEALREIHQRWPGPVKIMAQVYLEPFYAQFGFEGRGEVFWEDDIPHRNMVRPG
jgi:ElaA protein